VKARLGLVTLAASLLAASGAMAADLYIPPPAPPPAPTFSWDGPYIGAKLGGAVGTETDDLSSALVLPGLRAADSFSLSGFSAGVYAGNNWQMDGLVFGLEGELDYTGLSGNHDFDYGIDFGDDDIEDFTGNLALSTDWQAFAKARIGLPFDRFLVYATAGVGLAHATLTAKADPEANDDFDPQGGSSSNIHLGGLVGVGAEYAFTDQLSGRTEVDFAGFGAKSYDVGDFGPVNASWTQTTATVGLSLKF
jgi:outer membrane immunogenic protein